ncbi:rhodanese-related sulfurtransferase [Kordia sp.]|uniref:oxygen-dependent tRNA uridine(34) hydroxylase TrhO n=1 Tax=Kordia sp. TaxID=1965332 RepID=UPI003D6A2038
MQLYNKLSAKERAELIEKAGKDRMTISFYKYAQIGNPEILRNHLFINWDKIDVLGRIYVSYEGINAQLSVPAENFNTFKDHLDTISFLENVRLNVAIEQDNMSFLKLKVKVRDKIVADGLNDESFNVTDKGVHVAAEKFNELLDDKNTILVDMRNHYESEIGHFQGAITPDVDTFRESLPIIEDDLKEHKEDKNLVMYCTGGIRCEKASAYFKHKGFKKVYQLEGGIINYARQVEAQNLENKFIGKNFVFDHRRGERISDDIIANCHQCGNPCDTHVNCANEACHLLFIQCESCAEKMDTCCSDDCKEVHNLPQEKQKELRKGKEVSNKIFKKGRSEVLKYKK